MTHDSPTLPRRRMLQLSGSALAVVSLAARDAVAQAPVADDLPGPIRALTPMTDAIAPISADEHRARLARAQALLAGASLDAMVVGPGSSLRYFTGAEWGSSERFFGFVLRRTGDPAWIAPAFERDRAHEQIHVGKDVRTWEEDESPYALVAQVLKEAGASGRIGVEETMPFAFSDGIAQAAPAARLASATPVSAGSRMFKDAHELALMRRAGAARSRAAGDDGGLYARGDRGPEGRPGARAPETAGAAAYGTMASFWEKPSPMRSGPKSPGSIVRIR